MTAEPFPYIDARAAWRGDPAECRKLYRIFAQQGFAAADGSRLETAFWHDPRGAMQ